MSSFILANHMLLLYSLLYCIGDFLRAFIYNSSSSSSAAGVGLAITFFVLSVWLLLNALIYFKAFLEEMELLRSSSSSKHVATVREDSESPGPIEGTGVLSTNAEIANGGLGGVDGGSEPPPPLSSKDRSTDSSFASAYRRWSYYLHTRVGLAYFLNIIGSLGYMVSSLISLFLSFSSGFSSREIDKASLFLDCVNMSCFLVDGVLFWRVWWREAEEQYPTLKGKCGNVYMWANACNTLSSAGYWAIVAWSVREKLRVCGCTNVPLRIQL